jgi:hypothetical protein
MKNRSEVFELLYAGRYGEATRDSFETFLCEHINTSDLSHEGEVLVARGIPACALCGPCISSGA